MTPTDCKHLDEVWAAYRDGRRVQFQHPAYSPEREEEWHDYPAWDLEAARRPPAFLHPSWRWRIKPTPPAAPSTPKWLVADLNSSGQQGSWYEWIAPFPPQPHSYRRVLRVVEEVSSSKAAPREWWLVYQAHSESWRVWHARPNAPINECVKVREVVEGAA